MREYRTEIALIAATSARNSPSIVDVLAFALRAVGVESLVGACTPLVHVGVQNFPTFAKSATVGHPPTECSIYTLRRKMPHNYNRVAFQNASASANLLIALYCALVDFEIGLKEHFQPAGWRGSHKIIDWIAELGETAYSVQLATSFGRLICRLKDGTEGPVDGNFYPGLRYILHETDFPGRTTDALLTDALRILSDIKTALRARGIRV